MKLNGASVDARYIETIVIPRGETNYVFKARPLTPDDDKFFEQICPAPTAPSYVVPGGAKEVDVNNVEYVSARQKWIDLRSSYLFYRSLSATEELVWDTVKEDQPDTWGNVDTELTAAGFLKPEIVRIFNCVIAANGLDQSKIDLATKSFLATQAEAEA